MPFALFLPIVVTITPYDNATQQKNVSIDRIFLQTKATLAQGLNLRAEIPYNSAAGCVSCIIYLIMAYKEER